MTAEGGRQPAATLLLSSSSRQGSREAGQAVPGGCAKHRAGHVPGLALLVLLRTKPESLQAVLKGMCMSSCSSVSLSRYSPSSSRRPCSRPSAAPPRAAVEGTAGRARRAAAPAAALSRGPASKQNRCHVLASDSSTPLRSSLQASNEVDEAPQGGAGGGGRQVMSAVMAGRRRRWPRQRLGAVVAAALRCGKGWQGAAYQLWDSNRPSWSVKAPPAIRTSR